MKFKAIVEYEYPIEHKPPVKAEIVLHGDRVITDNIKALEQSSDIKEAYNRGYKDGQEALALHLELCKEEAEPCEDAISRQAVLDIAKSSKSNWIDNSVLYKRVNDLPPVKPQVICPSHEVDCEYCPAYEPKTDILDKIRAEIAHLTITEGGEDYTRKMAELYSLKIKVLQIIDKYKAESEGSNADSN